MDSLTYRQELLPVGVPDVESQRVLVQADGEDVFTEDLAVDATSFDFTVTQDSSVVVSLAYVDDAGNVSESVTHEFVATDTLPPEAPSGFGSTTLVSESDG